MIVFGKFIDGFPVMSLPMVIVLAALMIMSFCCGMSCRSVMASLYDFVKGDWWPVRREATHSRTVGTQSQRTYARDQVPGRFLAYGNGFRRGGEISVDNFGPPDLLSPGTDPNGPSPVMSRFFGNDFWLAEELRMIHWRASGIFGEYAVNEFRCWHDLDL